MNRGIPVGRILGIEVKFSYSVLLIAALYVYLLAQTQFPRQVFGLPTSTYWIAGVIGALFFFASLMAHEFGHAIIARRNNIEVKGITLWLMGGFAELGSEPQTPGSQFRIAAAGPVTNAVLGGVFYLILQLLGGSNDPYTVATGIHALTVVVVEWLAFINILLAAFNLLPAAPLDGGHLLSSGLWAATGNANTARMWAARAGMALGSGLLLYGIMLYVQSASFTGVWVGLVGWWIVDAARRDITVTKVERTFEDVSLGSIMRPNPTVLPGWLTIDAAMQRVPTVSANDSFPIQGADGRIVGLLSASQISHSDAWSRANTPIEQLAFPIDRVTWGSSTDAALPALRQLATTGVPSMLVVWPDGRVAGVVGEREFSAAMQPKSRSAVAAGR